MSSTLAAAQRHKERKEQGFHSPSTAASSSVAANADPSHSLAAPLGFDWPSEDDRKAAVQYMRTYRAVSLGGGLCVSESYDQWHMDNLLLLYNVFW